MDNINRAGYTIPTPVQKYSVPIVEAGRDLMACAQTGSGKTAAFIFPTLSGYLKKPEPFTPYSYKSPAAKPSVLVIAPTRELAQQIHLEASKFCYRTQTKPVCVFGGSDIGKQFRELERGCNILIGTPGRLADLADRGRISFSKLRVLVLDEADRMLDLGFEPQIRDIVETFDMPPVGERQTLMFSATFPKKIQILAQDFLRDYVFLKVGEVGSTSENITQRVFKVNEHQKRDRIIELIAEKVGGTLVFVQKKRNADSVDRFLTEKGIKSIAIHGDKVQSEREFALAGFRSGRFNVLVATAVASRGLDIPNVTHVINYDMPTDMDDYVHRIGRTGRAGNVGFATSLFTDADKGSAKILCSILSSAGQEVPQWLSAISRKTTFAPKKNPTRRKNQDFRTMSRSTSQQQGLTKMFRTMDFNSTPNLNFDADASVDWADE